MRLKRVFLYTRVSTEEQAIHGLSIGAQTAALEAWAKREGHSVVDVYTDAGISARKPASKRPELQRLLRDVQEGKGDLVVFTKLDRWFRNISEYYKVQEVLEKHKVDWKTIQEDYDTSNSSGRLKVNIMLSVAQDEADRTSERIKAIYEIKRQKLEPLTGDCPLGYKQQNKKYIKDPETEPGVSAFLERYMESGSVGEAQRAALEHGVRISYQRAHKMLGATCYYGRYFDTDGMTPPYISKEDYDKIQSMRKRVVRKTKKDRVYIFSGLISCGECGKRMGGRVNTNQASFFYNCTSHYMRASGCTNNVNILERKIEEHLLSSIEEKMEQLNYETAALNDQQEHKDQKSEIRSLTARCERTKDLYIDGLISREECSQKIEGYRKRIHALEKELDDAESKDFSRLERVLTEGWGTMYSGLRKEQKRDFWRLLVKEIRICKDRRIEYDLNI